MTTPRGRLALVTAGAAGAVAALQATGAGPLPAPPSASWHALDTWYRSVGPTVAALTGLRLAALAAATWALVAASLQLLAVSWPRPSLGRVADAVSPRALRRLARGAASLSFAVGMAGPPAPADPAGTAVMEVLGDQDATTTTVAVTTTTVAVTTTVPPGATPAPVAPARASAPDPPEEVVVARGDSFWSLAVDVAADGRGEVGLDGYWRRLVAANRGRLVDPANPDLLYPGQVLVLPPLQG